MQAQTSNSPNAGGSSGASGFSIETEMLTYRALESDSEAVACDVAAYLNGTSANFTNPPAGSVCDVKSGSSRTTVVVLPFDRGEFADFQLWRVDMITMAELRSRAAAFNCPPRASKRGATALDAALAATPVGPPLALAQSVLAILSSDESTSSVGGNIQDLAFSNEVSRQLRELHVQVMMPSSYTPYSLATVDPAKSPFLAGVDRLMDSRSCLAGLEAKDDTKNKDAIAETVQYMDAFLGTLSGGASSSNTPAPTIKPVSSGAPASPTDNKKAAAPVIPQVASMPAPTSSSHLLAVLSADGLAQQLGVDPTTGRLPDNGAFVHILLLKALESGGTVTKNTNVLGSKIRYSGGAVGTYALFNIDGAMDCSGNVYDYAGSIAAKDFEKQLGGYHVDPSKQTIFLRGSCSVPPQNQ